MARSSKEGQYYLMPLLLITMPLAMIPIMPTSEINLGSSLVPITGVMLLLRCLIEGEYLLALKYLVPVAAVTGVCCLLAIRWAEDQFNDESVLFRESERFDLAAWLRHLVRDRGETPSVAAAFMGGVILLLLQFFVKLIAPMPQSWPAFALVTVVGQLGLIVAPILVMTVVLTSHRRKTLLLRWPSPGACWPRCCWPWHCIPQPPRCRRRPAVVSDQPADPRPVVATGADHGARPAVAGLAAAGGHARHL